jgi:response regulator RpfG family c-di-GMP phosphodiesterase
MMRKILYIDDENINLELFRMNFENDFDVEIAESGKEGIRIAIEKNIQVVVSDLKMPEMNGIEMIDQLKSLSPGTVCILLSAYFESEAKKLGLKKEQIFCYITKPWRRDPMLKIIEDAFEHAAKIQNT